MIGNSPLATAVVGTSGNGAPTLPTTGLLQNYADLKAAIAGWLHRKDMGPRIPQFIALAEAKINRIGSVQMMEKEVELVFPAGSRSVKLPAGFASPIAVFHDGESPRAKLTPRVPEDLPVTCDPGCPSYWCIDGGNLAVDRPGASEMRLTLRYRGGFSLNDAIPTNTLLLKYPDLYLYGSLLASAPFLRDMDSKPMWAEMYRRAEFEVNRVESRARAAVPLRTDLAAVLGNRCGYDGYWE